LDFLVLELAAAAVDECFAVSEEWLLTDVDAEVVAGWLEVAAEARTAMLRAKRAVNFMLSVAVVVVLLEEVCGWVLVEGVDGYLVGSCGG
jgi:hypothetical protein